MRRKTLSNTLSPLVGGDKAKISEVLRDALAIPDTVRGETLSPEQYVKIAKALYSL